MGPGHLVKRSFCLFVIGLFVIQCFTLPDQDQAVEAQTDPPPFGEGDWIITDHTVLQDEVLRIKGNVRVQPGASLTLENTTVFLHMTTEYAYKFEVKDGGALYVYNNSFIGAFDKEYALHVEPGARFWMKNSTIDRIGATVTGSFDVLIEDSHFVGGGSGCLGIVVVDGKPRIYRTVFEAHEYSLRVLYGDIFVRDSLFKDSVHAMFDDIKCAPPGWPWTPSWINNPGIDICRGPRDGLILDSHIQNTLSVSLYIAGSNLTIIGNTIVESNSDGFYLASQEFGTPSGGLIQIPAKGRIENNTFIRCDHGIYVSSWVDETVEIVNNNFYEIRRQAVRFQDTHTSHGFWDIDSDVYVDASMSIVPPITIKDGGHLQVYGGRFFNNQTVFGFYPQATPSIPCSVLVESGGRLTMDKVTMRAISGRSYDIDFISEEGSSVHITNSTLFRLGYEWGTSGEHAGVYTRSNDFVIEESIIDQGMYGLIVDGGHAIARNCTFKNMNHGIYSQDGLLEVYDSHISNIQVANVIIDGGDVDLINTSFLDNQYSHKAMGGTLDVYWRCDLLTTWQNGEPVGDVNYTVKDKQGTQVAEGNTSSIGLSGEIILREFTDTGLGKDYTTPHTVTGTVMNMTNSSQNFVSGNTRLTLSLLDDIDPLLNITSHGSVVHQKNNTLVVNGTAMDLESGLDRIQWSFDRDLWTDANGLDDWNFTVVLGYGTTALYVRALDKAGNERLDKLTVTIDKDAPYLFILNPKDGFVTPLRTVLVEGFAEMGSVVTIGEVSVTSIDGKFRMSVPLEEGENILYAEARDSTGNTNSTSITVYRDTLPPVIVVENPPEDFITNRLEDRKMVVRGRTEVGALLTINGISIPLGDNGTFTFETGLDEGLNVITFLAQDSVGNQNTTTRRVLFDLTLPDLKVYSPEDGSYTNRSTTKVTGLSDPEINITIINGAVMTHGSTNREGRFEMVVDLVEGDNDLLVVARDPANNTKQTSIKVVLDTTPPAIILVGVYDGIVIDGSKYLLEGKTEPGAKVKVNNELVPTGHTGEFSRWVDLPSANNTVKVDSVDMAGNRAQNVTHLVRKPQKDPTPQNVNLRPDYFPWAVVVAVIVLVLQWVVLTRQSYLKANKEEEEDFEDEDHDPAADLDDRPPKARPPASRGRAVPRRAPVRRTEDHGPEFDEHDDMDDDLDEFERELDDEIELEVYQGGVRR
jgi:hypothetical protein